MTVNPTTNGPQLNESDGIFLEQEAGRLRQLEDNGLDITRPASNGTRVAGLGSNIRRWLQGDAPPTAEMFKAGEESRIPRATPEQTEALTKDLEGMPVPEGDPLGEKSGINLNRVHTGRDPNASLAEIETADDLAKLLEVTAQPGQASAKPHTFADIDAELSDPATSVKILKESFAIKGAWTDTQMHNAANYMASLGQQVIDIAKRNSAKGGDLPDSMLMEFQQKLAAFQGVAMTLKGKRREAARALGVNRKYGNTLDSMANMTPEAMAEIMGTVGGRDVMMEKQRQFMQTLADNDGKLGLGDMDAFTKRTTWQTGKDVLVYSYKAALLSNPGTHLVNAGSNFMTGFYESVAVRGSAGLISAAVTRPAERMLNKLSKGKYGNRDPGDLIYWDEGMVEAWASASALPDAILSMRDSWKTGQTKYGMDKADVNSEQMSIKGVNIPFSALGAADEFFKDIVYRKSMYAQAHRTAKTEGLSGQAAKDRINDLMRDPPPDFHDMAVERSKYETYTQEPGKTMIGGTSKWLQGLRKDSFWAEVIFPFVNTPANIMDYAIDNSMLSPLTKRWKQDFMAGGAKRDLALGRLANGTALTTAVWYMHSQGLVTGGGPHNWDQQKALLKTGWKPYSIRIGDEYIPYNRLGSQFGAVLAGTADVMDGINYAKEGTFDVIGAAMNGVLSMGRFAEEMPMLQGLGGVMDAMRGDKKLHAGTAGRFVSAWFPNFFRTPTEVMDPAHHAVRTEEFWPSLKQNVQRKLPYIGFKRLPSSRDLPAARYWDGSPKISENGIPMRAMGMFKTATVKDDPASFALIQNGIGVSKPGPMLRLGGTDLDLLYLDGQQGHIYDLYIKTIGETRRAMVDKVLSHDDYADMDKGPGSFANEVLASAMARGLKDGKKIFLKNMLDKAENGDLQPQAEAMMLDIGEFIKGVHEHVQQGTLDEFRETEAGGVLGKVKGDKTSEGLPTPKPPSSKPQF